LVNKSLVQLDQLTGRYRMLETIRLYALEKLEESGEREAVAQRHLNWCLQLAEDTAAHFGGAGQQQGFLDLESEQANLRAALTWAIRAEHVDEAARLALAMAEFWLARAYHAEARQWLEQILSLAERVPLAPRPRARLLSILGHLVHTANEFDRADRYHHEAVRIWRAEGDSAGIAAALHELGWRHFEAMELEEARRLAGESLAWARRSDEPARVAAALNLFAVASVEDGRFDCVEPALEESLSIWRDLGVLPEVAMALIIMARVEQRSGNLENAGSLMLEALRLQVSLDNYAGMIGCFVLMLGFAVGSEADRDTRPMPEPGSYAADYLASRNLPHGPEALAQVLGVIYAWEQKVIGHQGVQWNAINTPIRDRLVSDMGGAAFAREFAAGEALSLSEIIVLAERLVRPLATLPTQPFSDLPTHLPVDRDPAGLTARELEVLKLVASGLTNAQVAEQLSVTPRTVNAHLTTIYSKLGVTGRAGAIRFVFDHHLV
jgi:DNA-binding CsgD family transcriptional regulator/tetratricopeptide (TPR) repeat protein